MENVIAEYLMKRGYKPNSSYYSFVQDWENWRDNQVDFHEYKDQNGQPRTMYTLGMAKRVAEDWAGILYSERDEIKLGKEANQKYIDKKTKELKLNEVISDNIENAFALGTIGTIVRIENATSLNGEVVANENTKFKLINLTANQVVPLRVENNTVVDCAFVSENKNGQNENEYYIELHTLQNGVYHIENIYLDEKGDEIVKSNVAKQYDTKSNIPLFNLLKPRIVNNIDNNSGMGISVYANAIDQLKDTDIKYHNFVMDFYLGGKKIFYDKKLVNYRQTIVDGKTVDVPVYPDDVTKQQFLCTNSNDMSNMNEKPLMTEYNPSLRVDDNERGINLSLNLLAFKCGLGKARYKFENGSIMTATQFLGENSDFISNAKKHRNAVNEYVTGIVRAILLLGKLVFKEKLDENDEINLVDKDGFLISEEDMKKEDREALAMGLMSKITYLMKYRGLTEEQAREELKKIDEENSVSNIDLNIE